MKCPHCNGEIDDQQTNGDLLAPLGMGNGNGAAPAKAGKGRRAKLSPDWLPTEAQRTYCEQQGKDPDAFLEAFREYYIAKGTPWSQWGLVWMKACRDWKGHVEAQKPPVQRETPRERELSQWRARLACKVWNPFWGAKPGEPGCMVPRELLPERDAVPE